MSGADEPLTELAYQYGRNIGLAFQFVDDLLDFVSSTEALGKPAAADLKLGLATAPVLFACEKVSVTLTVLVLFAASCDYSFKTKFDWFSAVPRVEPDDYATVPGEGRRREGLWVGAQVTGAGADPPVGTQTLRGGDASGPGAGRVAVPEGLDGRLRPGAEPIEVEDIIEYILYFTQQVPQD